jgi:hypothetical protein
MKRLPTRRRSTNRWWWLGCVGAVLIVLVLLLQSAPTIFRARVHTKSLVFTIGRWESAGLFTSETERVDITLQTASRLTADTGQVLSCEAGSILHDVRFLSMSVPEGLKVDLNVEDRGVLRYTLTSQKSTKSPLSLEIGTGEKVRSNLECGQKNGLQPKAVWAVEPSSSNDADESSLEFVVRLGLSPDLDKASHQETLLEENITLEDGTGVLFERLGESSVVGSDADQLVLPNLQTPTAIPNGLRLNELSDAKIERLNFGTGLEALDVTVAGKAKGIKVKTGGRETQKTQTWLERLFNISWSSLIKAIIGLVSSVILGIYIKNRSAARN